MEARHHRSSSINMKNQIVPSSIRAALVSAVLEWFLIFLLFIDASFSYVVTKFARYCQLQIPCLLCSRLDHVLGKEKTEFYWDLLCHKHKLKISSLVLCHLHENLVDVHGMCESCLFSFATVNKSNAETYRLLVGKLGDEPRFELLPDFMVADDNSNALEGRKCTCCNENFISRGHVEMLSQTKGIGYQDFGAPLVATNGHNRVEMKDFRDVLFPNIKISSSRELDIDHLAHVEYQKVKATSDTESIGYVAADFHEPLLATIGHDNDQPKEFLDVSSVDMLASVLGKDKIDSLVHVEYEKVKSTSDTESVGYEAADPDAPLLMKNGYDKSKRNDLTDESSKEGKASQEGQNDINHLLHVEYEIVKITSDTESDSYFSDIDSVSSLVHVLNDRNQNFHAEYREKDLVVGDRTSEEAMDPSDVSHSSKLDSQVLAEPTDLHTSTAPSDQVLGELKCPGVEHNADAVTPDLISVNEMVSSSAAQSSANLPEDETLNLKAVAKLGNGPSREIDEMAEVASNVTSTNEKQSDLRSITIDTGSQVPNLLELGDAYKLAVGSRGRQLSGKLLDQKSFKDSTNVSEDFKFLLSQLSAARGIELQINDMSPRVSGYIDELRTDTSGTIGMQILQKRMSLERNESGISLDGSTVSEIDGESAVDRLKRQVEHDKKLMGALYKELEEERNASATAVNQAMAMITRLQEEKATLHMEALQCLRMMEEQAEYDCEALQKTTDLLAEKEKEIQDLKGELEAYKKMLGCTSPADNLTELNCDINTLESSVEKFETSLKQGNTSLSSSGDTHGKAIDTSGTTGGAGVYLRRSFAFEEESLNILQCLKELEKKFEVFSNSDSFSDTANGNLSEEEEVRMGNRKQTGYMCGNVENEESNIDMKNSIFNTENYSASEGSAFQLMGSENESKRNGEVQHGKNFYRGIDLEALRNEFLVLNNRLKALEVEYSFLKHSMSSVSSKGDEGLKFIQEMATQVRELHTLGIKRRN